MMIKTFKVVASVMGGKKNCQGYSQYEMVFLCSVFQTVQGAKLDMIRAFRCRVYPEHATQRKQFQYC
jgi:hypothetical protein